MSLYYKELAISDGVKYLPNVWSLLFKPKREADFFVKPWNNVVPSDCVAFRLSSAENATSEIYFCTNDLGTLSFIAKASEEIYLYGAYNQINVCQMRVSGLVACEEEIPEAEKIKKCLRAQILKKAKNLVIDKLSKEEITERLRILDEGRLLCFRPNSYAYAMYERG